MKTTKTGNSLTADILEVMYGLKEKGLLDELKKDLYSKYKNADGYISTFDVFKKYVEDETPASDLPDSDKQLADLLKHKVKNFGDKRQDFYDRIIDFIGRKIKVEKSWHSQALKIINEVDGLWSLGLKTHAEARFLKVYDIYLKNLTDQEKNEYSYLLSKIHYNAVRFSFFGSQINQKKRHEDFLERDEMQLIEEIERIGKNFGNKANNYKPDKWQTDSAVFKVFQVLTLLAKSTKDYNEADKFVKDNLQPFVEGISHYKFNRFEYGQRFLDFFHDNSPEYALEIEFAFYYYLTMERFHLALLRNAPFEAEEILREIYTNLNKTSEKSRHYLTGLILFLKLDLEQAQFALLPNNKPTDKKILKFKTHFLATSNELANLEVRLEVNKLLIDFFSTPERPDLDKLLSEVKILDSKVRGVHVIKLELELLKLLICLESFSNEKKEDFIRSVKKSANQSGRLTPLLQEFLKRAKKTEFTNYSSKKEVPQLVELLNSLRNYNSHVDNIILYWLNQFLPKKLL